MEEAGFGALIAAVRAANEKKLQERKGLAATRLQCVFRGRADRLTFYALRAKRAAEEEAERAEAAAFEAQMAEVRAQNARARAEREEGAAGLIGRNARGRLGRRRFSGKRAERTQMELEMKAFEAQMAAVAAANARARAENELRAATVLEACGRGYADRKLVGRLKVRQLDRKADAAAYDVLIAEVAAEIARMRAAREEVAAALLGRVVRGSLGRRRYGAFREKRTEEEAAMAAFEAQMKAVAAENARARRARAASGDGTRGVRPRLRGPQAGGTAQGAPARA